MARAGRPEIAGDFCLIHVTFLKIGSTAHYFVLIPTISRVVDAKGLAYLAAHLLTFPLFPGQPDKVYANHRTDRAFAFLRLVLSLTLWWIRW
jgi:hypothetical protein